MTLRPMRWWDVAPVVDLEGVLFPDQPWSAESFWAELALGADRVYLVAETPDAGLVGYAGLSSPPDARGGDAEVMTVAVAPAGQGRGVGRELVTALVRHATGRGAGRLLLEVRADNSGAQKLYAAIGFEQLARRAGYYHAAGTTSRPAGDVDALVLALPLRPESGSEVSPVSVAP